jgi:DNA replication and repair protein RecF
MYLRSIYLRNFRIYEEALFEFDPHINGICGLNAKGKTSLLEAIYLLITGRSFRNASSSELIRHGTGCFQLQLSFVKHGIEQILKMSCEKGKRKIIYNRTVLPSAACLLGVLKGGVLCPDDALLIKGAPSLRRQFLDIQIAQSDPLYVHYLTRFHKAMQQRNCLLRAKNATCLGSWEEEMAASAAYVYQQRYLTTEVLKEKCQVLYKKLTNESTELSIKYKSLYSRSDLQNTIQALLLENFAKNRKREMELGFTLSGPHKDDIQIMIGSQDARFFASEGQQRLAAAVLRLAEWENVAALSEEKPLMLVDDIGISLDENRKARLLSYISNLGQVMLTSTMPLPIMGRLINL